MLRGDARLAKEYEELVGYGKSRRWAPKLETIEEVVAVAAAVAGAPAPYPERRKSRALPFLGRLGSREPLIRLGGSGGEVVVRRSDGLLLRLCLPSLPS